jgi:two-component sensor histidine kinase
MTRSYLPNRLVWLGLLLLSFASRAEPLTPTLSAAEFSRLRAQLWRTPASPRRVGLLLELSTNLLNQHDERSIPLDSAANYAQEAYVLSTKLNYPDGRINSLYHLGWFWSSSGLDTLGPGIIRRGIALSQRLGRRRLEAFGWYHLAECYPRTPADLPAKIATYQRARIAFRQVPDNLSEAYLLKCIADMHQVQGHPEQAIPELLEVLAIYRRAGHRKLHYTYDLLSSSYRSLGDYKEALRYGVAMLESLRATADTSNIGGFYQQLGIISTEVKQYPAAIGYFQKALVHYQRTNDAQRIATTAGAIATILLKQGNGQEALRFFTRTTQDYKGGEPRVIMRRNFYLAGIYLRLRDYPRSAPYCAKVQDFMEHHESDDNEKMSMCQLLGEFYYATQRYHEASQYLQQALTLDTRFGNLAKAIEVQKLLFRVDSAQGHFPAAIAHYQQYKQLTDSVFNEKKNKQLATLQIQYDTRKKEQNIALLTKQAQMQQASLREREFQRNALVVGTLLLAGLLGLGLNRYRLKQRATLLLEAQQAEINRQNASLQHLLTEKDWMLKEIHHRVKNNLEVISSLLETQSDYLRDPSALIALREGQNRVHAMGLIHQKLYQSHSLSVVDMTAYIREIAEHLVESFDCQDTVQLHLNVAPIELDVTLATPLGLIINEALTNALKYAWPRPQPGNIRIGLTKMAAQHLQLVIEDDGAGFPAGFDMENGRTMGLTIMRGLSGQLDGRLRITQTPGVRVSLEFEVATSAMPARIEQ